MLLWSLCSFLLVESYAGNLRSHLISADFEKPVDLPEDVLERGETMYIPNFYRLARYVEQNNNVYETVV